MKKLIYIYTLNIMCNWRGIWISLLAAGSVITILDDLSGIIYFVKKDDKITILLIKIVDFFILGSQL